ncbi:MAG: M28 family peptidase [Sphingomonadaceae bacterium]|jgi:carboxypeptidase Q|nr:M28 family peptidase [Sphingomonadaceae bacterium]
MNRTMTRAALALSLCLATAAHAGPPTEGSGVAWDITEGLTTEIGQRLAGTEREAAARDWAVARLKALGFQNIRIEPFTFDGWVRGAESATLTAPYPHKLAVAALGYSAPTPAGGITAPLVYFPTLDALKAAPEGALKGKIAFIDHAMRAAQDGSGYGPFGAARRQGPSIAAAKGALGVVIRSIGTDWQRNPHTGATSWAKAATPIPAGAVSNPDADLIVRIAKRGKPMTLALQLEGKPVPQMPSGNVVAELPGRDPSLPPILVACHLDSWDLGTGAFDDAAGCGIVTEAALAAQKGTKPLRTIRVLWAGAEEVGVFGGAAYAVAHKDTPHALAMEADFGADKVWRVQFNFAPGNADLGDRIAASLAPLGIVRASGKASGGADVGAIIAAQKLAVIDLDQDGTRYFDLHHTPDDTLDKIDPAQLAQAVEAWRRVLAIVANEAGPLAGG